MNLANSPGAVLLLEDNDSDAFFFERAFSKGGFAQPLHVVASADEAIAYVAGEGDFADRTRFPSPVLVVLELNTPRHGGLAVLRWIRSQPQFRRLVVIVFTSSERESDVDVTYGLNVNSYLVKPADFDEFTGMVQRVAAYWLRMNLGPQVSADDCALASAAHTAGV